MNYNGHEKSNKNNNISAAANIAARHFIGKNLTDRSNNHVPHLEASF
jgi:hypothetical protein